MKQGKKISSIKDASYNDTVQVPQWIENMSIKHGGINAIN